MICYRCLKVYSLKTASYKYERGVLKHICCPRCGCSVFMGSKQ